MTTSRLLFAAVVLAAASGCARERVAYEVRLSSEPVRRSYRAPRPRHQEVVVRYAHGDSQHRCDAVCEEYWPDVYRHGQAEHRCDGTCPSYAQPRPQRRSVTVDHVQSFTSPSSSSTRFTTTAGVSTTFDAEPYDAYPTSSRVVVYGHGHARHRCAASCASYYPAPGRHVSVTVFGHGHRSHHCNTSCGSYRAPVQVVFSHGHRSHRCDTGCSSYRSPVQIVFGHGHHSHRCDTGCSSYRSPVQIVFGHGHHSHRCHSGCSSYRSPVQIVFAHGHHAHRCHSGCSSWQVDDRWSARRGGVVLSFGHGHARHVCGGGCSHYSAPRYYSSPRHRHAPRHHAPHVDVGVSRHHRGRHGSDVSVGVGFGVRWGRRR